MKQENLDEQKANGILALFPKLRDQNVCSELKVRQIERALEYSLDEIEQDIIRMKYLTSRVVKDLEVCEELGLKKDRYYILKNKQRLNFPSTWNHLSAVFVSLFLFNDKLCAGKIDLVNEWEGVNSAGEDT